MTTVISRMKVESFEKWHEAWNASRNFRQGAMKAATVLRDADAPNSLTILTRWETSEKAKDFIERQKTRIGAHAAPGSAPDWLIYDEAVSETY